MPRLSLIHISSEICVWPTGTRVDVVDKGENGKCDIYELKTRKAEPKDLYQLRMYWDGLVLEGIQPTRGILLTNGYSDRLQEMVRILNTPVSYTHLDVYKRQAIITSTVTRPSATVPTPS